jgi:cobalt-zinc-cadmium efflux system protein
MMIVEFIAGFITKSLMLVSDAIHMLSHASSLFISLIAIVLASKNFGDRFSFGIYRVEVLAALLNGITLAGFTIWIVYEAIGRIINPVAINNTEMLIVAGAGLVINLSTALILHRSGIEDINTKSAFLHMLADTYSSIAIILGGIVISFTRYYVIDPAISLVVAVLIARWCWDLLSDSIMILLEKTPSHIKPGEIKSVLLKEFPEIKDVHDIHIWEITSQFVCLSTHIVTGNITLKESHSLRQRIEHLLGEKFSIYHPVIQHECV